MRAEPLFDYVDGAATPVGAPGRALETPGLWFNWRLALALVVDVGAWALLITLGRWMFR